MNSTSSTISSSISFHHKKRTSKSGMVNFLVIFEHSFQKRFSISIVIVNEHNRIFCNKYAFFSPFQRVDLFEDCSYEQCGRAYFEKISWKEEEEQKNEKEQ